MIRTHYIAFTDGGRLYYCPGWAPRRIRILAQAKTGARMVPSKPAGATIWPAALG